MIALSDQLFLLKKKKRRRRRNKERKLVSRIFINKWLLISLEYLLAFL